MARRKKPTPVKVEPTTPPMCQRCGKAPQAKHWYNCIPCVYEIARELDTKQPYESSPVT